MHNNLQQDNRPKPKKVPVQNTISHHNKQESDK